MDPIPLPVRTSSAWDAPTIQQFLTSSVLPMRLGCVGEDGLPLVVSLWYLFEEGQVWCALHESAAVLRYLRATPKCGFEIAGDGSPYCGVRGQADVAIDRHRGASLLDELLKRYSIRSDSRFARWLVSRAADEYAVALRPRWITSWDYRARMERGPS